MTECAPRILQRRICHRTTQKCRSIWASPSQAASHVRRGGLSAVRGLGCESGVECWPRSLAVMRQPTVLLLNDGQVRASEPIGVLMRCRLRGLDAWACERCVCASGRPAALAGYRVPAQVRPNATSPPARFSAQPPTTGIRKVPGCMGTSCGVLMERSTRGAPSILMTALRLTTRSGERLYDEPPAGGVDLVA